ncbi:MAG: FHA domain-containing protein [Planctomycetota bacterium]
MGGSIKPDRKEKLELPSSAALVRVTAGVGSPAQKTWNLRRPVTLIGSGRPASIVLHDQDVAKAHCVIVHSGTEILLKDLQTSGGTFCNKGLATLIPLSDGDVITVGETRIQIAIQVPLPGNDDSGCELEYSDPTKFLKPVFLTLEHTDQRWQIDDAVAFIGRHEKADIRLDNDDISVRQAVLFRFCGEPAIFDFGGRTSLSVNGRRCNMATLVHGDRVGLGGLTLLVGIGVAESESATKGQQASGSIHSSERPPDSPMSASIPTHSPATSVVANKNNTTADVQPAHPVHSESTEPSGTDAPLRALSHIEAELTSLRQSIANSWGKLNSATAAQDTSSAAPAPKKPHRIENPPDLDARETVLRGKLRDLEKYHEQLAAQERELAAQISRLQVQKDETDSASKALKDRESDLAQKQEELKRREHVLAQRWTRLLSATCPHCSQPINIGQSA